MSGPLLKTKLSIPVIRTDLVERPRLIEQLYAGLRQSRGFGRKLTLVSAPAGFGKTTLVVDWLNRLEFPTVWVSLDAGDNDPARFLAYLLAALEQIDGEIGAASLAMLHSPQPPPNETILNSLINDLAEVHDPFTLALDDYHNIQNPVIHQRLGYLLEHQPEQMHQVILTREDPLLPISRLRARGQVCEIRQEDLRFTTEETADFLHRRMGMNLAQEDLETLHSRTEGWVTGLQLAILSLQHQKNLRKFVASFAGSNRYILDYLFEEIFSQQSTEMQRFLMQTSILDRLTADLCMAVTGQDDSRERLEMLERNNLFIVPLDPSREWYRYHHLFEDLLRHQRNLHGDTPAEELHLRASAWFEEHGFISEAVEHNLAAKDWERAAALIEQSSTSLLKRGEMLTLVGWCQKIPQEFIRSNPGLGLTYAWALMPIGRADEVGDLLDHYEEIGQAYPELAGQVATAQAFLARTQGNNQEVIRKSKQALAVLPASDYESRSMVALNLGLVYWHEGELQEAVPVLSEAQQLAGRIGNHYGALTAQIFLARTLASQGKLCQAEALHREIVEAGGQIPILALAHYDLSGIYHEWDDLDRAWEHLERGMALCTQAGNVEFQNGGRMLKSTLLLAQGDTAGALAEVEATDDLSPQFGAATVARGMACHVLICLAMGDTGAARSWVERMPEDIDANSLYRFMGLTIPRLLLAEGRKTEAAADLAERSVRAAQGGWGYALVVIRALQALAAEDQENALRFLGEALVEAEPERYLRSFTEVGQGLVSLLREAARRGVTPRYVGKILETFGETPAAGSAALVEPLSERELEVLRLVAAGLSNREIGEKLFITIGTAKTHVHNICGKLGVRNRTEAAMRAGELELL